jgi:hypothetical protein
LTNEIKLAGGGTIRFCINGAPVQMEEVRALVPRDIIRVEYHDNPGLRYGDASAVIDYIVKRKVVGGYVSVDMQNSPTVVFGDDQIAARINHKKSEFGLMYTLGYRHPTKIWADRNEEFRFEDGTSLQRIEKGIPGTLVNDWHRIGLSYSLLEQDKYYFTATLRHRISDNKFKRHAEMYAAPTPNDVANVYTGQAATTQLPSLDLYYQHSLKNKQTIVANVVGTYIGTNSDQIYQVSKNGQTVADINSAVVGKKYSLIGEGIYEKSFDGGQRLGFGLKHTQGWTDNQYTGTLSNFARMKQSDTYLYSEFRGKIDKLSYTAGIGVSRSWYQQGVEDEYEAYIFRPKATLQYNFTGNMFLRLTSQVDNTVPDLAKLSAIDQYIDTLQIYRGNPNLKPNLNYVSTLFYEYRKGLFTGSLFGLYINCPNAIMEEYIRENGMFIRTFGNQNRWQKMNGEATLRVGPVKKMLMFSLTGGINHFISDGREYFHTYTNPYCRASVMAMYKKFMAMFQMQTHYDHFGGENRWGGEDFHMFMLRYNPGKFSVGAGIMLPFSKDYRRYEEILNQYASSQTYTYSNDFSRMIVLNFSWNFNFGRTVKSGEKRLNNEDTDSGVVRTK